MDMKQLGRGVVAALLLWQTCGCSPSASTYAVNRRDLVGTYEVRWEPYPGRNLGHEILSLRPNGTFQQLFTATGGRSFRNSGTWVLESESDGSPLLHLIGARQYVSPSYDVLARHPIPEHVFQGVRKRGGQVLLLIDEDSELYYKKRP